jgi:arginyl-tRNA synthetase
MKQELEDALAEIIQTIFSVNVIPVFTRPDEQFGDYTTNVAMRLASRLQKKSREIADVLADAVRAQLDERVESITVAGPGFLNITLHDRLICEAMYLEPTQLLTGQVIVAEYSDPNPFKVLHAGHLYTSIVGDAIANLCEAAGGEVHRVNFGGDVGLHVAKTMWALLFYTTDGHSDNLEMALTTVQVYAKKSLAERAAWLASNYVKGTQAYEDPVDNTAKEAITSMNGEIYRLHTADDHSSLFAQIYWLCREWSYAYFDDFYAHIGTKFEKYYPESETASIGLSTVQEEYKKGVYEKSDGAIVFKGEPYGLHTRVFINSNGLPTYEAKDVGLIMAKWRDYHFDQSIVITANDIVEYMKVVLKSIEQFAPELALATTHLTHGVVKLAGGVKMSSRKGNFLRATDVLDVATKASMSATGKSEPKTVLGAVKYAFLKQRMGGDIIYEPEDSVSIQGNSGPYLQYAHARACSILRKIATSVDSPESIADISKNVSFDPAERSLARKIAQYSEVVDMAIHEYMPHYVATYLYELAQVFNRFYEHNRVLYDERQLLRTVLVERYVYVLKTGLELLGIDAPETM